MTRRIPLLVAPIVFLAALRAPAGEKVVEVPIRRVVLFAGGVGYFEHEGTVTGDATVRLMFRADQINDVLKSMSVHADAGTVGGVSYASSDPLLRALKSFAVDLSGDPTLADLLKQLRGAEVKVLDPAMPGGKILGIETRKKEIVSGGKTTVVTETLLNLVGPDGVRSIPMRSIDKLALADEKLAAELNAALAALIGSHDAQRKPVDIRFAGKGERTVRIGYLVEAPIWKTSYRLDLSGKPPRLQGWAIVENTSDADWTNVELTLVSGKPVSFVTDLYRPLRIPRTIVEPKRTAIEKGHKLQEYAPEEAEAKPQEGYEWVEEADFAETLAGRLYGRPGPGRDVFGDRPSAGGIFADDSDDRGGVRAMALAERVGELFRYRIDTPVTLGRRRSAMLPIIHRSIEGGKVSVYDVDVLEQYALNGAYLVNDTGLKLLGGPVTIFDGKTFAGEAMLDMVSQKDRALLSYAVDLHVKVEAVSACTEELVGIAVGRGRFVQKIDYLTTWAYEITSTADEPRQLIVCTPRAATHKLVAPKAAEEQTDDEFRFRVDVPANATRTFAVRLLSPGWGLLNLPGDREWVLQRAEGYVDHPKVPKDVRAALSKVIDASRKGQLLAKEIEGAKERVDEIKEGQERLRENVKTLGPAHPLSKRYIDKLTRQEDEIEELEKRVEELTSLAQKESAALRKLVASLKAGDQALIEEYERLVRENKEDEF